MPFKIFVCIFWQLLNCLKRRCLKPVPNVLNVKDNHVIILLPMIELPPPTASWYTSLKLVEDIRWHDTEHESLSFYKYWLTVNENSQILAPSKCSSVPPEKLVYMPDIQICIFLHKQWLKPPEQNYTSGT